MRRTTTVMLVGCAAFAATAVGVACRESGTAPLAQDAQDAAHSRGQAEGAVRYSPAQLHSRNPFDWVGQTQHHREVRPLRTPEGWWWEGYLPSSHGLGRGDEFAHGSSASTAILWS